ncbi:site-specific integrase [Paraburkholderia sp.]|uniref:site-specific integrase n=1 Tax=Paraburkholderia sp. TaxID=1926495 RepID=UPI0025F863DF|nr:site-specific integrase [Paraburkholderia sp.]
MPANIRRTSSGWQYRKVIPADCRQLFGKREVKASLGPDLRIAKAKAAALELDTLTRIAAIRERLTEVAHANTIRSHGGDPVAQRKVRITHVTGELVEQLKNYWLSQLREDARWRAQGITPAEWEEMGKTLEAERTTLQRAVALGDVESPLVDIELMLEGYGYQLDVPPEERRRLGYEFLIAQQQVNDILLRRQRGELVPSPQIGPRLRPAREVSADPSAAPFGWEALLTHWQSDRKRAPQTEFEAKQFLGAFQAFLKGRLPHEARKADVTEWLRFERDSRNNGSRTLEKKGTLVGAIFSASVKDELLPNNPFAGYDYARLAAKIGVESAHRRLPFELDDLRRIFGPDGLVAVTKVSGGGGYYARVWLPLLALFTGARLDELGCLTPADVLVTGCPRICIRQAKNPSSVREVPLHPKLIELGWLDYVESIRKAGHATLWPHMASKSTKAADSEVLGRWFNRWLHDTLKLPASKVFHSFRHTFKDLCRNALIPRDVHQALTGHAKQTVGDTYGTGFSVETKASEIARIVVDMEIGRPLPYGVRSASGSDKKGKSRVALA